jgi:hypothetical protein
MFGGSTAAKYRVLAAAKYRELVAAKYRGLVAAKYRRLVAGQLNTGDWWEKSSSVPRVGVDMAEPEIKLSGAETVRNEWYEEEAETVPYTTD